MQSRRRFIRNSGCLSLAPFLTNAEFFSNKNRLSIGACDWSIGKSSDPCLHLPVAKEIGLQGIMVNIGNEHNNMHLRQKKVQQYFLKASEDTGVKISSVALAELNNIPYKSDPRTIEWVHDSVDVAKALGCTCSSPCLLS
jgi:hypothetical protein